MIEALGLQGSPVRIAPGGTGTGFLEGSTYQLIICGDGATLVVDDVPLERCSNGVGFTWRPGFFAGQVKGETIDVLGRPVADFWLDVGPSAEKLGKPTFQRMVDELFAFRPGLVIGTEAAGQPFGHEGNFSAFEVEYARLRQYGGVCISALRAVCQTPLTQLQHGRRMVQPHQARKIDSVTVSKLARSPVVAAILGHSETDAGTTNIVSAPFAQHTVDSPANRAIAAMVIRLLSRVARLTVTVERIASQPHHPMGPKVARRLQLLDSMRDGLLRVRRSGTLSSVTRAEVTAAGLVAVSAHPEYARAYGLAWKVLRNGVESANALDMIPLSPTWEIYERWCFLQVARALERLLPDVVWKAKQGSAVDAFRLTGSRGDTTITVWLQARFRAWDVANERGFRSLSGERVPDIVVTFASASSKRFLVLDAKYRTTRLNVLDAMSSAHVYRDALLWGTHRPWKSLLLIPRGGAAPWLGTADYQRRFCVGTLEARESGAMVEIDQVLERFVAADE